MPTAIELIKKVQGNLKTKMDDIDVAKCIIAVSESELEAGVPDTDEQIFIHEERIRILSEYLQNNK